MTLILCVKCDKKVPSTALTPCSSCFFPFCSECLPKHEEEHRVVPKKEEVEVKKEKKKDKDSSWWS